MRAGRRCFPLGLLSTLIVALLLGPLHTPIKVDWHDMTPNVSAAPSALADFPWPAGCNVSEEDVRAFDASGFVILRQAVDPAAVDLLLNQSKALCAGQLRQFKVCQIEQLRWQVDLFRDMLFRGPLGCLGGAFIRGRGVRVVVDGLFGLQHNLLDPLFFSYHNHVDNGAAPGMYGGLGTGTRGVSVWLPLQDVDHSRQGGSVYLHEGFPASPCKFWACGRLAFISPLGPTSLNRTECGPRRCWQAVAETEAVHSFRRGDVAVWHPDMLHRSQPVRQRGFTRYAFFARLADADAVDCIPAARCSGTLPCCRDQPATSGARIHSHCSPQLHPSPLQHEVDAHFSPRPKHQLGSFKPASLAHLGLEPFSEEGLADGCRAVEPTFVE